MNKESKSDKSVLAIIVRGKDVVNSRLDKGIESTLVFMERHPMVTKLMEVVVLPVLIPLRAMLWLDTRIREYKGEHK